MAHRELLVIGLAICLHFVYQWFYAWLTNPPRSSQLPRAASTSLPESGGMNDLRFPSDARKAGVSGPQSTAPLGNDGAADGAKPISETASTASLVVEVREFLSGGCQDPPSRVWYIRPPEPGAASTCMRMRPKMVTPGPAGRGAHSMAPEVLYGRVSCGDLRRPGPDGGGFLELCETDDCEPDRCMRINVVEEGACGTSFTGFAAASWRCVPASSVAAP